MDPELKKILILAGAITLTFWLAGVARAAARPSSSSRFGAGSFGLSGADFGAAPSN